MKQSSNERGSLCRHELWRDRLGSRAERLLMDFTPETVMLRYFKWNQKTQPVDAIDALDPFHTTELKRA